MNVLILIYLNIILFFSLFVISSLAHKLKLPFKSIHVLDLMPVIGFLLLYRANIMMTPFTLFKHLLLIWLLVRFFLAKAKYSTMISLAFVTGIVTFFFFLGDLRLNSVLLSSLLTFGSFITLMINLDPLKEHSILLFLAIVIWALSNHFVGYFFGAILLMVYQTSVLSYEFNLFNDYFSQLEERNKLLETKFDRAVLFEAQKRTSDLKEHVGAIREKTVKDPLTNVLNRLGISNTIDSLIEDPSLKIFTIVLFDIDDFKKINDLQGHIIGDQALLNLVKIINHYTNKRFILGRFGGDEFILIMPATNAPIAYNYCEKLKMYINKETHEKLTVSMGLASYPFDGKDFSTLLSIADKGLYQSKEKGKNKVSYLGKVPMVHSTKE